MRPKTRRAAGLLTVALVSMPLALLVTGSSQAAPTLTIAEAQARLTALQTQEDAATEAYNSGQIAVTTASRQAAAAGDAVRRQTAKLARMQQGIAAFAVATYTGSGINGIDSLLAGGDPADMIRKAGTIDQIARANQGALTAIRAQELTLVSTQRTASDRAAAAKEQLQRLNAARTQVQQVIAQEQSVLSHLQAAQRAALEAQQAREQAASRAAARQALAAPAVATPRAAVSSTRTQQPAPQAGSGMVQTVLNAAYSQQGKPYVYGAAGPNSYDCSGLVLWAFAHAGISLPHSAAAQYGYGTHVTPSQLEPGDIVFFNEGGTIGHNGIYVGNGKMIDANHTGGWVGVRPLYPGLIGGTRL